MFDSQLNLTEDITGGTRKQSEWNNHNKILKHTKDEKYKLEYG